MCTIQDLPKQFFHSLPQDVLSYILPFTYKTQCPFLLDDIRNFVVTKTAIQLIYYERNKDLLEYEPNADLNWLINDILVFHKNHINKDSYKKMIYLLDEYVFLQKNIHFRFNTFWSFMSPFKRILFINIRSFKKKVPF